MNKLFTIATLLLATACSRNSAPNKTEIILLGQAPEAVCDTATTAKRKIDVVVCVTGKQEVIAISSKEFAFQVYRIKSVKEAKEEEKAKEEAAKAAPAPAPAPVVPAPAPAAKK